MEHSHSKHFDFNIGNAFKVGIIINIAFVVIEVLYGIVTNSMALIADAGHNFSDVLALVFSWIGVILSQRKPTLKFTYGFRRSTILIALLNTILLLVAVAFMVWETTKRFRNPVVINSDSVIMVAAAGIVVNGFTAWLFLKGKKHDLNIRSAFLHFIADTLVSLGVLVAGILMTLTGINWIDSLVSLVIIVVILYSLFHLLVDSVNLALDAVPENIDINAVRAYLNSLPEVIDVHDLHIWALSTTDAALTAHIVIKKSAESNLISMIAQYLSNHFHIGHSTIQIEYAESTPCSEPCN